MGMSPCYSLMRGLLIVLSIIFLVMGMCVCGVCVWGVYSGGVTSRAGLAGLACGAGGGALLALAALLGAAGAARRRRGALAAGAALGALLAAGGAAAAAWGAMHTGQLQAALRDHMRDHLTHHYGLIHMHTQLIDTIQDELQCCGVEGPRDWSSSLWSSARLSSGVEGVEAADSSAPLPHSAPLDLSVGAPSAYYYVPASCCNKAVEAECTEPLLVPMSVPPVSVSGAGCGARVWLRVAEWGALLVWPVAALGAGLLLHAALAATLAVSSRTNTRYKA